MNRKRKVLLIVGTRPNFIKIAPIYHALCSKSSLNAKIVHTGQHYDKEMNKIFFDQLNLPKPDHFLGINGGTDSQQKARIMLAFEEVIDQESPDLVLVVGDVNSTLACALVTSKKRILLAHVEAGLRSGDTKMSEEINRILTDHISDFLFATEESGVVNLQKEGISESKIFHVGNVMIDTLLHYQNQIDSIDLQAEFGLHPKDYILITIHRPSNVDYEAGIKKIIHLIDLASQHQKVVLPLHPRSSKKLKEFDLFEQLQANENVIIVPPQGYIEFIKLTKEASLVITDSGGVQEETTFLNVPCLTFRSTTERPVTVEQGTNELIDDLDPEKASIRIAAILDGNLKKGQIPPLWDGSTAIRIVNQIEKLLG